jgi:hypothetical protein
LEHLLRTAVANRAVVVLQTPVVVTFENDVASRKKAVDSVHEPTLLVDEDTALLEHDRAHVKPLLRSATGAPLDATGAAREHRAGDAGRSSAPA